MVKDNHVVAAGGVLPAYLAVRAAYPDLPVEVEVTDLDQLRQLLEAGCDRILLDNMDSATMSEAVRLTAGRASLEASGGLTLERAREVAQTSPPTSATVTPSSDWSALVRSRRTGVWPRSSRARPTNGRC